METVLLERPVNDSPSPSNVICPVPTEIVAPVAGSLSVESANQR